MTVKQLIQNLSKIQDQEVRVMVRGYEGGVDDIGDNIPAIIYVALDVNQEWYYGKHERVSEIDNATNSKYHIVRAIVLG